ncbi:hypothetical protein [Grimontia marina]|uniref:Uncharacterized protein n=1 Tax=Grimontia marina TaxID=646534 RepID=A0A128F8M9_9GAMM|nr:hypothetical protein [Grimontia marina]CZF83167.1 hypothetical protein GMA8713_02508 [Grimontia marina]
MDKKSHAAVQWIESRAYEDTANPEWPPEVYFLLHLVRENAKKARAADEEEIGEQSVRQSG